MPPSATQMIHLEVSLSSAEIGIKIANPAKHFHLWVEGVTVAYMTVLLATL